MEEIAFKTGCPVANCENNRNLLYWRHYNCGAHETINSEGIVKCNNGHNLGEFFILKYNCSGHRNGFQYGRYSEFLAALSICSNFSADFAIKLTDKLSAAYKAGLIPKD